ncbi:TonB-dependent receptor plug domain-containing protein [Inhella gelatinilytica]|uniref:TonB-dependent receptor n=1 Tax=Inhella gelatinilytica TaxID=2795030 RepID=A0A931N9R4_9BURK|nr:TonB-dependent receptor [Inhella gelatinilytica]MBH9551643.1 TonB-dependent receptor [Inhella gelatinilytica]
MRFRMNVIPLAVMALASQGVLAQQAPAPKPAEEPKLEKVVVTGSLIKRTDKETPAVVQTITRDDIQKSGYSTVEDMLRASSAVDSGSISDGAASGFVGGLATVSLRGFGSQGTLVLINGRRIAPVAAVDINFGRGSLISVNTIPRDAIERIEILKDGASALYGSDAMAGVVNYVLRKDYEGISGSANYGANDQGVGVTKGATLSFGMGNIDTKGFNLFGGLEVFKRDSVMHADLRDRGNLSAYDDYLLALGSLRNFTPWSSASTTANYYRVPTSLAGSTTINGISVANNSLSGINYLGTMAGCPAEAKVGQGYPQRPEGYTATTPSLPNGLCRFDPDSNDEAIAAQERVNAMLRGTLALNSDLNLYADLMVSTTKTTELGAHRALTSALVSSANPVATSWTRLDGTIGRQNAIILPVGHPDNPTNGTATAQPVQLIYRFPDLGRNDINDLKSIRATVGLQGVIGEWDIDSALLYTRMDNKRTQEDRLRSSLLTAAIASGSYRFNGSPNSEAAIASVASDAVNEGESTILALDMRASRDLFKMQGGMAAVALGGEVRREELTSTPDANYQSGDYIGLVANGAKGSRNSVAAFGEFRLPLAKTLEAQTALRFEKYSDFGNATTGKLGFKWSVLPSTLALRGTVASGFRAPSITQIGDSFALSFHNSQTARVFDSLRCNSSDPAAPKSLANPSNVRDCNVLGYTAVPAAERSGSLATFVGANADLKPETSRSATAGLIFSPTKHVDLSLDYWYFERRNEIRAGLGADIMAMYNANPSANAHLVLRDPNPATWLPGVPNSGPILALMRRYDNFNFSKTSGLDYDLNVRFPVSELGKVKLKVTGTWTHRFDRKILSTSPTEYLVGTTTSDIPKSRNTATLSWERDAWGAWARVNHTDQVLRASGVTTSCLASTTAANKIRQTQTGCYLTEDFTHDLGFSYTGFKGWTIAGTVLNVGNTYGRTIDVPASFNHWDGGSAMLGRRYSLNVSYELK